jgi:hypothetical protein
VRRRSDLKRRVSSAPIAYEIGGVESLYLVAVAVAPM